MKIVEQEEGASPHKQFKNTSTWEITRWKLTERPIYKQSYKVYSHGISRKGRERIRLGPVPQERRLRGKEKIAGLGFPPQSEQLRVPYWGTLVLRSKREELTPHLSSSWVEGHWGQQEGCRSPDSA